MSKPTKLRPDLYMKLTHYPGLSGLLLSVRR